MTAALTRQTGHYGCVVNRLRHGGQVMVAVTITATVLCISSWSPTGARASVRGEHLVPIGEAHNVGPLRITVVSATGTVQPHTYRLRLVVQNRTKRPIDGINVQLLCEGVLAPSLSMTGAFVGGMKIPAHSTMRGPLTLDPPESCAAPSVRLFAQRTDSTDGVVYSSFATYSLAGLI